jgi:hypothetical protein
LKDLEEQSRTSKRPRLTTIKADHGGYAKSPLANGEHAVSHHPSTSLALQKLIKRKAQLHRVDLIAYNPQEPPAVHQQKLTGALNALHEALDVYRFVPREATTTNETFHLDSSLQQPLRKAGIASTTDTSYHSSRSSSMLDHPRGFGQPRSTPPRTLRRTPDISELKILRFVPGEKAKNSFSKSVHSPMQPLLKVEIPIKTGASSEEDDRSRPSECRQDSH